MYLNQRPQVILLEQVGLFRNLQDKTVPLSSNQQACNILPLAELNSFQEMKETKEWVTSFSPFPTKNRKLPKWSWQK